jgi:hypothetical protein
MSKGPVGATVWCLVLCGLAVVPSASAQDRPNNAETNAQPIVPFLEGTDVFTAFRGDTRFEANIFPHLIAYQNYSDLIDVAKQSRRQGRPRAFAFAVSATPAVRIRMFNERSAPVRTPSYMPRGNFQMIWARNLENAMAMARAERSSEWASFRQSAVATVSLYETHLVVGHHSNGQDGCLFTNETPEGDDCVAVPGGAPREINTKDGSFSTNYVRVGTNYRRNYLDEAGLSGLEWGFRFDVEYHPRPWVDPRIVDLYGRLREEVGFATAARGWRWCGRRAEISGSLKLIHSAPEGVSSLVKTAQVDCFPWRNGGWGFFVRYYHGQDYYNIGFLRNISRVHAGATFNQNGFFRFRSSEAVRSDSGR